MKMTWVAIIVATLTSVIVAQQDKPVVSQEVLQLRVELQGLKEQLRTAKIASAQCDAGWADTRARLASIDLTAEGERLSTGRDALEKLAKDAGLEVDWVNHTVNKPEKTEKK